MQFINENIYKDKIGIYGIKNLINNKIYVGQTGESFQRRYWHHRWKLQNNQHDNQYLQNAWNKYGEDNFCYMILETVDDLELLNSLEMKYISIYKKQQLAYNMSDGGDGKRGCPMSDKAKRIVGEKNRQNMLGKKHSEETKEKMSKIRKGKYVYRSSDILNEEVAFHIKQMLVNGYTASEISKELDVGYKLINNIISNNTWSTVYVEGWDEFRNNRKTYSRLTKEDHLKIYKLHIDDGLSKYELADMYGKTVKMIERIFREQRKLYDNPVPSLN